MSNKLYTSIPAPKVPRNVFNLSRYNSLTMPYQRVCPAAVQEIIPGDSFRWASEVFCRTMPMVAPVMTDQKISLHSFFVPLRTVNSHFAEFMFNNKNGNYTDVLPYVTLGWLYSVVKNGSILSYEDKADIIRLYDYIGLPFVYSSATTSALFVSNWLTANSALENSTIRVNLAPFIAYTKIWNEYFRDENLVTDPFEDWIGYGYPSVLEAVGDRTSVMPSNLVRAHRFASCFLRLRPRAWQHDRFTSSLPFAQRGPDVLLPVTGTFDVTQSSSGIGGPVYWDPNDETLQVDEAGSGNMEDVEFFGEIDSISTTINDFRRAERLQRWYENSARGGVRPNEATLAHFGVRTPDATLDRAEFLGGTMQPIVISEIPQTSQTTTGATGSPQGTLAGKGTSYKTAGLFKHFFTEHGFVFVFASALIRPAYWQGVPRIFSRMQRDEYYWPEFALLGEEPVFDKELFVDGSTTEDGVFGYVPRYADYKSAVPEVHGDFRSSLDFWVNPRKFASQPNLNAEFIFGNPQKKMYAVQSDFADSLLVTIRHNVKASRLMPFYGVPTI